MDADGGRCRCRQLQPRSLLGDPGPDHQRLAADGGLGGGGLVPVLGDLAGQPPGAGLLPRGGGGAGQGLGLGAGPLPGLGEAAIGGGGGGLPEPVHHHCLLLLLLLLLL